MIHPEGGLVLLSSFLHSNQEVLFLASDQATSMFSLFLLPFPSFLVITASSTFMYFVALKSISAMILGSFFSTEKRNSPSLSPLEKAVIRTISFASSISRSSLLSFAMYDLKLLSSLSLIYIYACVECLCLCPLIKWVTKLLLNSLKVDIEFGLILLNQTHTNPFKMVGKALHIIPLRMPWR